MLFTAADRIDASPRAQQESSYQFLDRVKGRFWDRVRDLLESWVSRYPPDGAADLVGRLTADDIDFRSAFWELYLHELVLAHGAIAHCHPSVPGSSRRPDFLIEGFAEPFYLEAKVLEPGEVEGAKARQRDEIWNGIDQRVRSEDFFLQVEIDTYGRSAVPISSLAESIEHWLHELDPALVRRAGR